MIPYDYFDGNGGLTSGLAWLLFSSSGEPGYYLLYKDLEKLEGEDREDEPAALAPCAGRRARTDPEFACTLCLTGVSAAAVRFARAPAWPRKRARRRIRWKRWLPKASCCARPSTRSTDRLIRIFTPGRAVLTAAVKGVRRPKAKLKFAAQPFSVNEYTLAEKNGYFTVTGCSPCGRCMRLHTIPTPTPPAPSCWKRPNSG